MLWQRLLFGTLMIAALAGIVALDFQISKSDVAWGANVAIGNADAPGLQHPLLSGLPITLLVVVLAVMSSYELGRVLASKEGAGGFQPVVHWAAFVAAGVCFIPWMEMQSRDRGIALAGGVEPAMRSLEISLTVLWLVGGFLGTCLLVMGRRTTVGAVGAMAGTVFIIFYIGVLASFVVRIRCMWPGPPGAAMILYLLLTVKSADIGAYFVGMSFGRHKLVPWLSPGKTIEGAVGAILAAVGVAVGGMLLWERMGSGLGPPPLKIAQAIILGIVMAIAGHLGDLVESLIKRDAGHKDSGAVVPAFGGLLDIMDSPLFTAPIGWWLLTIWSKIG